MPSKKKKLSANTFFRKLIENSFSGITLLDKDLRTIYRSTSAERITGWNDVERQKNTAGQMIHPNDREQVLRILGRVMDEPDTPFTCTFRSLHFAGHYIWLQCTFTNRFQDPDIDAIVCNFIDISDRQHDQEKIAENERFIKTITDNLPALIAYWTADLQCLFANKPYLDWFGLTLQELRGMHKSALLDRDYATYEPYIQAVLSGTPQSFERTFEKAGGQRMPTHTQYLPDAENGRVKGFYSLIYDTTAIKHAEAEITEKNRQLEALLENMTDGFISLDKEQRYTYANRKIGELLGMPAASLIGRQIWEVFPDVVGSSTYQAIQQAYTGQPYVCNEDHYPPLNLWQENRIYSSGGGVSVFIRDITAKKREELQKESLVAISRQFKKNNTLEDLLTGVLEQLARQRGFLVAEAWLIGTEKYRISRVAHIALQDSAAVFFEGAAATRAFRKGEGLPGITWDSEQVQFWPDLARDQLFLRRDAAEKAGLRSAYGIPLNSNGQAIGVLLLASAAEKSAGKAFIRELEEVAQHLAGEIRRKQLEQELDQVFQFTPDILCVAHTDGYFKKVNPAMCQFLGYSADELLAQPFISLVHPDDRDKTAMELQNIVNGTPTYYIENRYITHSGQIKWLAWTTTGALEQGTIYCSAKDITEKKELEMLLHKATSLARIGGWEIDLLQNSIYWSAMTREIHEVPPDYEPDLEKGLRFYRDAGSREAIRHQLEQLIEKGTVLDAEAMIVTAQGNTRWVRVIGEADFAGDRCVRVYGSFQDIDALKRAELAATQRLQERDTILESIGDAFFAVDEEWIVTYWNNMAEKLFNTPRDKVLNKNLLEVFPGWVGSPAYQRYLEVIAIGKAVRFEHQALTFTAWLETSVYPAEHGLAVYIKDITERKNAEQRLLRLNEDLQKQTRAFSASNAELEQFAYVASHDLQEPLRMVTSFLTQLEQKYGNVVDDKGKRYIHFAVDGAKRMRQIILDLLEFSRVGRSPDQMETVNTAELVQEVLALYRKQIEEQKATFKLGHLPVVRALKVPLRQVFQNLVSNALKYQPAGQAPDIGLDCTETAAAWQFVVRDNGIGVDAEYFDRIFVIFQRLHQREDYPGTGMGLAITKKIIENQGGRIWLESAAGSGTAFYFTIPKTEL